MPVLTQVGQDILREGGNKNCGAYRGILRLLAQFGYASIQEVMFGFDLRLQEAINRLVYLEKVLFIVRFPSHVHPDSFFCLTPLGRQAVQTHGISDQLHEFYPSKYRLSLQNHHRMIMRASLALQKVFGGNFQGWVSEQSLRKDMQWARERVFDGKFFLKVRKERYKRFEPAGPLMFLDDADEIWSCGLEMELTLKSRRRYEKQFRDLADAVYDRVHEAQKIPMFLFLYHSRPVYERLVSFITSDRYIYGKCLFVLGEAERFLKDPHMTPLIRYIGKESREIRAREMNKVKMLVPS